MSTRRRPTPTNAPELGEIEFDDWYEMPVFEVDPDERFEQLATSKRGPVRLIGSALLRLSPDRPKRTRRPWRVRWERMLDRWAEAETAGQERLEGIILPKRWRT